MRQRTKGQRRDSMRSEGPKPRRDRRQDSRALRAQGDREVREGHEMYMSRQNNGGE